MAFGGGGYDYADPLTPEVAEVGRSKKKATTFLKMFRFDKARTPRNQQSNNNNQTADENLNQTSSVADQSIDYANYLLEIQEGKQSILQGKTSGAKAGGSKLIRGDVQRETIDFYDLRESGAQHETQKM